jgi:hypothetical protein
MLEKIGLPLALSLVVFIARFAEIASAADLQCLPDGVCCAVVGSFAGRPDRRCGTLEYFQRYAKIVCLKGDAIENKSLPEAIEASSQCIAAKRAATTVEEAPSNAAAHQRALNTQQVLREMGGELAAAKRPVAGTCFQGECLREFVVSLTRETSGLVKVRTRVEHYCMPGSLSPRQCADWQWNVGVDRAVVQAAYEVQCKTPGGYVQYQNGRTEEMPKPFVSHGDAKAAQLWAAVCHQPYPQGWPQPQ